MSENNPLIRCQISTFMTFQLTEIQDSDFAPERQIKNKNLKSPQRLQSDFPRNIYWSCGALHSIDNALKLHSTVRRLLFNTVSVVSYYTLFHVSYTGAALLTLAMLLHTITTLSHRATSDQNLSSLKLEKLLIFTQIFRLDLPTRM